MPDVPEQVGFYSIEMDSLSSDSSPDLTPTSPTSAEAEGGSTSASAMDIYNTVKDMEVDNTNKPDEDDKSTPTRDLPPSPKTETKASEFSHPSAQPIPRKNIKLESTATAIDKGIGIVNGKREKLEPLTSSVTCGNNGVTTLKSRERAQPSRSGSMSKSGVTPKRTPKAKAKGSSTNTEEEVIKRRLHIEHQGDEAKILKLMKVVCNFGLEKERVPTPVEKVGSAYESMKVLLRQMEYNARKDHHAITTIESTHHLYDDLSVDINDEISKTRELLTSIKGRAAQIKEMQNNNLILEAANTMIQNLPLVKVGEKQLAEQENKLQKLQRKKRELGENIMAHVIHTNKAREEFDAIKTTFGKSKDLLKNDKK